MWTWKPRGDESWIAGEVDGWAVAMHVIQQGGSWVVGELEIRPRMRPGTEDVIAGFEGSVPAGGLTAQTVRRIPLTAYREVESKLRRIHQGTTDRGRERLADLLAHHGLTLRPARYQRRGDPFYAAVAVRYGELVRAGSRRPVSVIAEEMRVTQAVARDWVKEARRRELLTGGGKKGRGQVGGVATAKARRIAGAAKPKARMTGKGRKR